MNEVKYYEDAKNILGEEPIFLASAPGRLDLLNTHQDYKGLSVVPVAINLRTFIYATPIEEEKIVIFAGDLAENGKVPKFEVDLKNPTERERSPAGYVAAVVRVTKRLLGERAKISGLKMFIRSDIPIGAGLASSGALEVATLTLFNGAFNFGLNKERIAEYSFLAESYEMGIPCGRLDQYASSYGGVIVLKQKPTINVEEIRNFPFSLVAIDSGEKHSTEAVHTQREREINDGLRLLLESDVPPKSFKKKLGNSCYETNWEGISRQELMKYLFLMPEEIAKRFLFTIDMNNSTELAISILKEGKVNVEKAKQVLNEERVIKLERSGWKVDLTFGEIVNYQHELLRDMYEVSTNKIERIRNYVLASTPVLGIKISGAGMGGSLVAITRNKEEAEIVAREAQEAGAARAIVVSVDDGAKFFKLK